MLKAFGRLFLVAVLLVLLAAAVAAWAMAPRHFPGSVACRDPQQQHLAFYSEPGSLTLLLNDCLLSTGGVPEIRTWYSVNPLGPIANLPDFPHWIAGPLSFSIDQTLSLEPAILHLDGQGDNSAGRLNTAIVTQTSYTFAW